MSAHRSTPAKIPAQPVAALEQLGFAPLEAAAYAFLVSESPAGGYRIAQALGKPFGSVYKALEGLEAKGAAILSEESGNRVARPVSISTVIRLASTEFERSCRAAAELVPVESESRDTHLYTITDRRLAFEQAREMIEHTATFLLINLTPGIAREVIAPLETAIARGVRVGIKAFAPLTLPGADIAIDPRGVEAIRHAPGEWLVVSSDGREQLEALFEHGAGELLAAHWTENPLLAWTSFTGLSSDFMLAALRSSELGEDPRFAAIVEPLSVFESPASEGKEWLKGRFRRPSRGARTREGARGRKRE